MNKFLMGGAAILAVAAAMPATAQVTGAKATETGNYLTLNNLGLFNGSTPVAVRAGGAVRNEDLSFADQPAGSVFGGTFLAAGPSNNGAATLTFSQPTTYLSFLWGSPDLYNRLTITTIGTTLGTLLPATVQQFTAADLGFPVTDGSQNFSQYVEFKAAAGRSIGTVTFSNSPATDAFEAANFSTTAVPEPASWALMLAGFGAVGFAMRRRQKVRGAVAFA